MIVCLFARKVYDVETITKAYRAIGLNVSQEQLVELGERIYAAKLRIKEKLGFDFRELRFPRRFFETPSLHGQLSEEKMLSLLDLFLKKVRKNKEQAQPRKTARAVTRSKTATRSTNGVMAALLVTYGE